uniref:CC domain-containing protein n=1 Tax=Syphacia muris TaxID=451379 RepID=A0A0N5A971_9BILA
MPILDPSTNRPKKCNPSDPYSCDTRDKSCEKLADGSYSCCSNSGSKRGLCKEAIIVRGKVVTCNHWTDNSCPEGSCRKGVDGRYYCCKF